MRRSPWASMELVDRGLAEGASIFLYRLLFPFVGGLGMADGVFSGGYPDVQSGLWDSSIWSP